jgi:cell division protein FtsB
MTKEEIIAKAQRRFLHITEPKLAKALDRIDELKAENAELREQVDYLIDGEWDGFILEWENRNHD